MRHVLEHRPHQCTLVPDTPSALTSDHGWDTHLEMDFLTDIIKSLHRAGIRVSIFVDASPQMIEGAALTGADRVELYTGPYAAQYGFSPEKAIENHIAAAQRAKGLKIGVNAGHDLNLENLRYYRNHIPNLLEVSIGHALVTDAIYYGLSNVIGMYQSKLGPVGV
jgi:pyridoxine 5-phosphate synthase